MRLRDILTCYDFGKEPPNPAESLLRSNLANLLQAVELGHLAEDVAATFLREAIVKWRELSGPTAGTSFASISIDGLWGQFRNVLVSLDGARHLEHRGRLTDGGGREPSAMDAPLMTVVDDRAFEYWLKSVPGKRAKLGAADVLGMLQDCMQARWRQPGARVGRGKAVVWLTPKIGEVGQLVDNAAQRLRAGGEVELEAMPFARRLQDRLGLWDKNTQMHAIAVVLKRTYRDLIADPAVVCRAPTIFDAEGHARFRHWPCPAGRVGDPMGRGRTWELDADVRASHFPYDGAPEIVAPPRPFEEVDALVYLGRFATPRDMNAAAATCDAFAAAVAGDDWPLPRIVDALSTRLKLM